MPSRKYPSDRDRFAAGYAQAGEDDCWLWAKGRTAKGYGTMRFRGKPEVASRISYTLNKGEIPHGLFVLHKCDNPLCVNPAHLFLGTNADNIADKTAKSRQSRGASHSAATRGEKNGGAKLTANDVSLIRSIDNETQASLARRFGVGQSAISNIRTGSRWSHVPV